MPHPVLHLVQSNYFADGDLPFELARRAPQAPFPLHTHDFSELVIVLSGRGTHFTDLEERLIVYGDAFLIEAHQAHGYRSVSSLELINILFDPVRSRVSKMDLQAIPSPAATGPFGNGSSRWPRLTGGQLAKVAKLVEILERECREKQRGYQSLAISYFLQIIGFLARYLSEGGSVSLRRPAERMADALHFIQENRDRTVRMSELVAASRLSESTLLRGFKNAVGLAPLQYHLQLRIEHACALLSRPELSITEVSYQSGFSDSNYFSRQFRKLKHTTPREFRKEAIARGTASYRGPQDA